MAVENITRFATASELFRLFNSIFADIYRQVQMYENLKSKNETKAIEHLKNAITKPANVKARALEFVANYTGAELSTCIAIITDGVTLQELNTELTAMETYCQNLYDAIMAETMTWDEASANLQSHFEDIMPKITFPFPAGYTDIWGR